MPGDCINSLPPSPTATLRHEQLSECHRQRRALGPEWWQQERQGACQSLAGLGSREQWPQLAGVEKTRHEAGRAGQGWITRSLPGRVEEGRCFPLQREEPAEAQEDQRRGRINGGGRSAMTTAMAPRAGEDALHGQTLRRGEENALKWQAEPKRAVATGGTEPLGAL